MITLTNVSKKFKDVELFENVDVTLPENKKVLIKGVNGSGKSVLLKMLVGYSLPDEGSVKIDDYTIGVDGDFIPNAGVSINAPEFVKTMTGLENLKYLANIKKIATDQDILNLAEYLDLKKSLHKKYKTFSLGMRQKMRIIQAVFDDPKYIILDEPFDALDQDSRGLVMQLLDKEVEKGKTLIFTSHNIDDEKFADVIFEINKNKLEKK